MEKSYLLNIVRIVEGAANADLDKVRSYTIHLADQLERDGDLEGGKRLRKVLSSGKMTRMHLAKAGSSQLPTAPLPVDSESRMSTAEEEFVPPDSVDLYLSSDVSERVRQFLVYFRAADRLIANGVGVAASMLMYGPPGCGKTQLARFIASELQLPLITARIDGLISSYLGSTAKNLRQLFEHAMSRPCVLFLDEFDALAKKRDDSRELGELKRVVISLLQNIDAMGADHVILAATNHEHLLDPAIWRRFAYRLHMTVPDKAAREQMSRSFFRGYLDDTTIQAIAALSEGLTGAQLRFAANDSIREAVLANQSHISPRSAIEAVLSADTHTQEIRNDIPAQLQWLRRKDPKAFSQKSLAEIYGISQGQVSKLMKEVGQ